MGERWGETERGGGDKGDSEKGRDGERERKRERQLFEHVLLGESERE